MVPVVSLFSSEH